MIDSERAARDALARTTLAAPKTGPEWAALQTLLAAQRRGRRDHRAAPVTRPGDHCPGTGADPVRGHSTRTMIDIASRVRPSTTAADVETFTVLSALRARARRIRALETEAAGPLRA